MRYHQAMATIPDEIQDYLTHEGENLYYQTAASVAKELGVVVGSYSDDGVTVTCVLFDDGFALVIDYFNSPESPDIDFFDSIEDVLEFGAEWKENFILT